METSRRFELRPYQRECIEALPQRGAFLVHMATGLGKTVTFSQIPRQGRMLILSHREELVYQPRKYFSCSYGVEQAGNKSNGEEVVSASVQSLVRRLKKFDEDAFDVIITDEAHHATACSYMKIYDHFKPRLHLGFTATPNRHDGVGLEHVYEDIVFERDLEWGIKNGFLSPIRCLRADIDYDLRGVAIRMGDYAPSELEAAMNIEAANKAIADTYQKYAAGQTLIFACSVAHAKAIAKEIPGAVAVVGGEEREETLAAFSSGALKVLVNCMVFTEGTDLPNIETVIIARPTKNISLYTQMVGRGTRLFPGKEKLTLIDCVGSCDEVDICTAPSLIGMDIQQVREKEKIEGDLFDLPELIKQEVDNPGCWVKNVEYVDLWARSRKYKTHGVNYYRMPDGAMILSKPKFIIPPEDALGRTMWNGKKVPTQRVFDEVFRALRDHHEDTRNLWDLSNVKRWGAYQATDKQKELVSRFGLSTEGLTKLDAMQILTRVMCRVGGA